MSTDEILRSTLSRKSLSNTLYIKSQLQSLTTKTH